MDIKLDDDMELEFLPDGEWEEAFLRKYLVGKKYTVVLRGNKIILEELGDGTH